MAAETKWVTLIVADGPDMFSLPEIGLKMQVTIDYSLGTWSAEAREGAARYYAEADSKDEAILALLRVRLGYPIEP